MKEKKYLIICIILIVLFVGFFVYPTVYRYDKLNQGGNEILLRTNKITGNVEWVNVEELKWEDMADVNYRIKEELNKQRNEIEKQIEHYNNFLSNLKEFIPEEDLNEKELFVYKSGNFKTKTSYLKDKIKRLERDLQNINVTF